MKILIVDDEKSIRFALKDIIEFEGHEVSLAADGKEGLEMALANSYDVIFSDIKMPVMDGVEMLEKLMQKLSKEQGVTEELKAKDQMLWVQLMNNLRQTAEETVLAEVVYS